MDTCDAEICGFLDVKPARSKHIAQKMRKKALVSSKVWKRYWCSVMKSEPGLGIKVQFGRKLRYSSNSNALKGNEKDNFVVIPPSAVIYRIHSKTKEFAFGISAATDRRPLLSLSGNSETETQRWIADIRRLLKPRSYCAEKSYNVSIIDNVHSKAAGLTGLHGDLSTSEAGIFIKDIYTGEIAKSFEWKEFGQFHLTTAGRPEDVKRICVMHTTKEFRRGIGELYMFCLDAGKLLQDLVTQGRGSRHRQSAPSTNDEKFKALVQYNKVTLPRKRKSNGLICLRNTENDSHDELDTSFSSGIYEEIVDDVCSSIPKTVTSNTNNYTNDVLCNQRMIPPPLPPRQSQKTECIDKFSTNTGQYTEVKFLRKDSEGRLSSTGVYTQRIALIENSNYVPMSPQWENIDILRLSAVENEYENDYLIMQ